ncbi:MAG TPA: AlpA family phage regulatory protein [Albitalea sp.]|uniref:helix-turn-helix transcriptional regulator n=1 Tax=Piscinibacter sp. TaxID=1903157 RepID=UPI002ED0B72B
MGVHKPTRYAVVRASGPQLLLRLPSVLRLTGLGRSTIYRLMAQDRFPAPVRLSERAVGWRLTDLEEWTTSRPAVGH